MCILNRSYLKKILEPNKLTKNEFIFHLIVNQELYKKWNISTTMKRSHTGTSEKWDQNG